MLTDRSAIKMKHGKQWYRYILTRVIYPGKKVLGVIMLNPSIADSDIDDPTIRRVCDFANRWGFGTVVVGNLYAAVSTDPGKLSKMKDPVGRYNDMFLRHIRNICSVVVAGWGTKADEKRVKEVRKIMGAMYAFRLTKHGHPAHPLYLPKDIRHVVYK